MPATIAEVFRHSEARLKLAMFPQIKVELTLVKLEVAPESRLDLRLQEVIRARVLEEVAAVAVEVDTRGLAAVLVTGVLGFRAAVAVLRRSIFREDRCTTVMCVKLAVRDPKHIK